MGTSLLLSSRWNVVVISECPQADKCNQRAQLTFPPLTLVFAFGPQAVFTDWAYAGKLGSSSVLGDWTLSPYSHMCMRWSHGRDNGTLKSWKRCPNQGRATGIVHSKFMILALQRTIPPAATECTGIETVRNMLASSTMGACKPC